MFGRRHPRRRPKASGGRFHLCYALAQPGLDVVPSAKRCGTYRVQWFRKQEQMPLYEYECAQCHRRTEKIQKFSDAELTICPFCGGPLARTLTAPAIQFKGSGWYKDLYSSPKPAANTGTGEGAPAASSAGGETSAAGGGKSDAAPAAAATSTSNASPAPASSGTKTA